MAPLRPSRLYDYATGSDKGWVAQPAGPPLVLEEQDLAPPKNEGMVLEYATAYPLLAGLTTPDYEV
jgi:hypothetical protein